VSTPQTQSADIDFAQDFADIETTGHEEQGDGLPRIWWHNGQSERSREPGSFYVKADSLHELPGEPWRAVERFEGEDGFAADALNIIFIGYRSQPFLETKEGDRRVRTWLTKWQPGARILTEMLALVDGIDEPVVLSVKGMTGSAFTKVAKSADGLPTGIIPRYQATVLRAASRAAGKPLDLWLCSIPVSSEVDSKGRVVYRDTGHGSKVTPPAAMWDVTDDPLAIAKARYVGKDVYVYCTELRKGYDEWLHQRRATEAAPAGHNRRATEAAPAGHNVPVDVGEDDEIVPF
jgi:hypothetical protein